MKRSYIGLLFSVQLLLLAITTTVHAEEEWRLEDFKIETDVNAIFTLRQNPQELTYAQQTIYAPSAAGLELKVDVWGDIWTRSTAPTTRRESQAVGQATGSFYYKYMGSGSPSAKMTATVTSTLDATEAAPQGEGQGTTEIKVTSVYSPSDHIEGKKSVKTSVTPIDIPLPTTFTLVTASRVGGGVSDHADGSFTISVDATGKPLARAVTPPAERLVTTEGASAGSGTAYNASATGKVTFAATGSSVIP